MLITGTDNYSGITHCPAHIYLYTIIIIAIIYNGCIYLHNNKNILYTDNAIYSTSDIPISSGSIPVRQPHPPVLRGQSNISLSERYEMAKSVHPYAVPRPAGSTEGLSSILGSVTDLVLTNDTVGFARRNSYDVPKPASTIPTELDSTSNMYIYINGGTSTEKTYSNMGDLHRAEVIRILAKYTSFVPLLICIVIVIVYIFTPLAEF